MTTDTQLAPTDAEIAALRSEFGITSNGRGIKEFTQVRDFARAVLARWGQPAHSGEPVAWLNPYGGVTQTRVTGHDKEHFSILLYTAQPVEREPLTPEQRSAAFARAEKKMQSNINLSWRDAIADEIEAAHGIKGGQP